MLFLLATVLFAQEKSIRVEGRVLTTGGEQLRKATVTLQKTGLARGEAPVTLSANSSDSGEFRFNDVQPGRYTLSVEKPGFVRSAYGATTRNLGGTPIVVNEGQAIRDLNIRLTPQGVITGTVTDRDGDPVQGAQVILMQRVFLRGKRQLALTASASSDDQGRYRLAGLAAGRYYLAAERRTFGLTDARETFALTYYPNTTDPAASVPVDVTAGNEFGGFDLRLVLSTVTIASVNSCNAVASSIPIPRNRPTACRRCRSVI